MKISTVLFSFGSLTTLVLFQPFSALSQGTPFAWCNGTTDDGPNAWICNRPNGLETGEEPTTRCQVSTQSNCQIGAGGESSVAGFHNVPRDAWFLESSKTPGIGMIRCQCGCFTGDMSLLTTEGWLTFQNAALSASKKPFRVAVPGREGKLFASEWLANKDFTVGPEEKPVIRLETTDGSAVHLTENHPVLIVREDEQVMVQAKSLRVGDSLLRMDGQSTSIKRLNRFLLPAQDKKVFNVDTKEKTAEGHVILVNGLQMGDVKWQLRLSEREAREENLRKASL